VLTTSFIMSVCLSVRPIAWNNSASTEIIFMKFDIRGFFKNQLVKLQVH